MRQYKRREILSPSLFHATPYQASRPRAISAAYFEYRKRREKDDTFRASAARSREAESLLQTNVSPTRWATKFKTGRDRGKSAAKTFPYVTNRNNSKFEREGLFSSTTDLTYVHRFR
jgi:hypothetical protein